MGATTQNERNGKRLISGSHKRLWLAGCVLFLLHTIAACFSSLDGSPWLGRERYSPTHPCMLTPDDISALVHAQYARLPKTGKPQAGEWTVLAGFVLVPPTDVAAVGASTAAAPPRVVALGTGTKCLTAKQIAADTAGECLHDAHAEIVARRALRAFLLNEVLKLGDGAASEAARQLSGASILQSIPQDAATPSDDASVLERCGFELRPGAALHFYTSEPPCGDAAIFDLLPSSEATAADTPAEASPTAAAQPSSSPTNTAAARGPSSPIAAMYATLYAACHDDLPVASAAKRARTADSHLPSSTTAMAPQHRTGARPAAADAIEAEAAFGGAHCLPGLLRTKPGRGDRTSCMSCSDKLARWCALGMQGALLSMLLPDPIVPASVTVGQPCSLLALQRAIARGGAATYADHGGGENSGACSGAGGIRLCATSLRFEGGPPEGEDASSADAHTCSNSLVWCAGGLVSEAINGLSGKRLGANKKAPSPKHRSAVCKARAVEAFREVLRELGPTGRLPAALSPRRLRSLDEPPHTSPMQSCNPPHPGLLPPEVVLASRLATVESHACGASDGTNAASGGGAAIDAIAEGEGASAAPYRPLPPAYTYEELKALASAHKERKAALLSRSSLSDWVRAPRSCEAFGTRCCPGMSSSTCRPAAPDVDEQQGSRAAAPPVS